MNWGLTQYTGQTALAYWALATAILVWVVVAAVEAWLVWRRRWWWCIFPLPLFLVWGIVCICFGPKLDHSWLYLQENAQRSYRTYCALTWATAFVPPYGEEGVRAFSHIATRDTGFAKGKPVSVRKDNGHIWEKFEDEDYPGGVLVYDGRPVYTGKRFESSRLLTSLIPLFEMPTAKRVCVLGDENWLYKKPYLDVGLEAVESPADIVLLSPAPDWQVGADTPTKSVWQNVKLRLSNGGVAALHINARLLSLARLKGILADFQAVFGEYRIWCVGRYDFVITNGQKIFADEVLDLFDHEKVFKAFTRAGITSPLEVMACYVGSNKDIEQAFEKYPAWEHQQALYQAPKLAFSPVPVEANAPVEVSRLMPYYIPKTDWLLKGQVETPIFTIMTNGFKSVQGARRDILMGFEAADKGNSTNAVEQWSIAAKVNATDPLLQGLGDSLDLEGRRYLRIGNVNGAIRCYENRLLIFPNDVAAVHNFGICLKRGGHHDIAASVFAKAVKMDPLTDEHRYELVECCAASKKEDIACRQLDVLMKRHPDDPALMMRAAKLLALRSNKARDESRAIKLAEEAVRITNWKDRAYVQALADVYIESGRMLLGMGLKKKMREMKFEK